MKSIMIHRHVNRLLTSLCWLAACLIAPLASAGNPHFNAVYNNTFALSPGDPETPSVLNKVIEGKGFNSLLGESSVRFEGVIDLSSAPFVIEGVTTFTVQDEDGTEHTLVADTTGLVIPAESDANLVKLDYHLTVTSGTGKFAETKGGYAKVLGAALFQNELGGTASWSMSGFIR